MKSEAKVEELHELPLDDNMRPQLKVVQDQDIDETLETKESIVRKYHSGIKDVDSIVELCPHCKEPTTASLRRLVVDTAMAYIAEKDYERDIKRRRRNLVFLACAGAACLALAGYITYFLMHSKF